MASLVWSTGSRCAGFQGCSQYVGSAVAACRLSSVGSAVVVQGLSCLETCGIFPDQESPAFQGGFLTTGSPALSFDMGKAQRQSTFLGHTPPPGTPGEIKASSSLTPAQLSSKSSVSCPPLHVSAGLGCQVKGGGRTGPGMLCQHLPTWLGFAGWILGR